MQRRKDLILYNVLNQEVVFEEYFCNLLSFEEFRKKFLNFISQKSDIFKDVEINYSNFSTEENLGKFGRADIYLKLENKEVIFEIKNKIYTDLTENQPINYLKYLENNLERDDYNKYLFFLIPRNYKHLDEIYRRWNNIDNEKISGQIFFWEDFVLSLKDETNPYIKIFYDFCMFWFNLEPIVFSEDESQLLKKEKIMNIKDISIPTLLLKLESLTRKIGDNLNWKLYKTESGFYYSKIIGEYEIFIGVDYSIWEGLGQPFSIMICDKLDYGKDFMSPDLKDVELIKFRTEETEYYESEFYYVVKYNCEIGDEDFEEQIRILIKKIEKQLEVL